MHSIEIPCKTLEGREKKKKKGGRKPSIPAMGTSVQKCFCKELQGGNVVTGKSAGHGHKPGAFLYIWKGLAGSQAGLLHLRCHCVLICTTIVGSNKV